LGLGLDNPCRAVFWVCGRTNAWRGLMTGIFGVLESSATQWYQDVASTRHFFFHRPIYSLWRHLVFWMLHVFFRKIRCLPDRLPDPEKFLQKLEEFLPEIIQNRTNHCRVSTLNDVRWRLSVARRSWSSSGSYDGSRSIQLSQSRRK
jgi:hypothetical protein